MHLYAVPLLFALVGLTLYTVLGGADFGAGFWHLTAGRGAGAERLRDQARRSMAPVWEANHVWLIFTLVVLWTAYPVAFGSLASTLTLPLFLAAVGIVLRGAAYVTRTAAATPREARRVDWLFAVSSVLTPLALGAAVGGVASGRVPVGNAAGDLVGSWLNPTSALVGALAVATAAHLAAVYLAADSEREGQDALARRFRARALAAGVAAGILAAAGMVVLHGDAPHLFQGLTDGRGRWAVVLAVIAAVSALILVWPWRLEAARYAAAGATAAIIAGWALAQSPALLPGLTVRAAAAPRATLVALVVVVLVGGAILLPCLVLLFRLALRGGLAGDA